MSAVVCSDPLPASHLAAAPWGSTLNEPIKGTISHFQDLFSLFFFLFRSNCSRLCQWMFKLPLTSLTAQWRWCVCVYVREREREAVGGAVTPPPQKEKSHTFQIKTADKWPHDVEEIKGGGRRLNWILRRLTVYDLNLLGIGLRRAGSGSSPRLRPHLGPPCHPWGICERPWSYSTHKEAK